MANTEIREWNISLENDQEEHYAAIVRNSEITYVLIVVPQVVAPGHTLWRIQHLDWNGKWIRTDINPAWDSEKKAIDAADKMLEAEITRQNNE